MLLTATPVGVLQGVRVVKLVDAVYALVPLAQVVATCTSYCVVELNELNVTVVTLLTTDVQTVVPTALYCTV